MLTKQLNFGSDVLGILGSANWSKDGLECKLTTKIQRELYERVDKALVALGGKWNKKAGGHVFPTDPRVRLSGLLGSGGITVERDGFFDTPEAVVERMLELVKPRGLFLEPSAGMGAILRHVELSKESLIAVEKNPDRADHLCSLGYRTICGDFLTHPFTQTFDTILMNPPFEEGQEIDHVRRAYDLLADGGEMVSVMSPGPFFRDGNKEKNFRYWIERMDFHSENLPDGSFTASGTGVRTRLLVAAK